ncbi:hypothetical protein GCM10017557_10950 [Streptomyces aurantiacus]|uniref:Uncharacterized protein n=1 Tax=Streptomyces aurantiacus TaxID=47760 RepID=A0A7G1NXH7_9ACTN|nr:hypothetical protein GCM10017557_10950 [Streptomyces aurantiacus]
MALHRLVGLRAAESEYARADVDAGGAQFQRGRIDAGPFEELPGRLQEHPLLRVHGQCLARADPEERGVEAGRVMQESALAYVAGARVVGVRVVEALQVPPPVGGELPDGVAALGDEVPQFLRRPGTAGEAARHRDDRDRLLGALLHLAQTLTCLAEVDCHPLQILTELVLGTRHRTSLLHR